MGCTPPRAAIPGNGDQQQAGVPQPFMGADSPSNGGRRPGPKLPGTLISYMRNIWYSPSGYHPPRHASLAEQHIYEVLQQTLGAEFFSAFKHLYCA